MGAIFPDVDPLDRWKTGWAAEQAALRSQGQERTFGTHPESRFGHNDYLGLRRDPRLVAALIQALGEGLPTTSSGSRLLSGNLPLFSDFEREFAQLAGMPSAFLFSSASEANRTIIQTLVDRRCTVIHDALAHASLIDGIVHSGAKRRKFLHNSPEDLRKQLASCTDSIRLVVTESVFSMDGDVAPLADILKVCEQEGALLLVDEAHAVGLFGPNRTGLCESLPRSPALIATTHGFGKALASAGGMLCTVPEVIERITNRSRAVIFTTAPSPLAVRTAFSAWRISREDSALHSRRSSLCSQFHSGLCQLGWDLPPRTVQTPIFPLLTKGLAPALSLSERLASHGIFLRPIRPPTVAAGTERLRATISADLNPSDLGEFLEVLGHV